MEDYCFLGFSHGEKRSIIRFKITAVVNIEQGDFMNHEIYMVIRAMADKYATDLRNQVDARIEEMKSDDNSHYLLYWVLGISDEERKLTDLYQNKGRFLYKYAGTFLEKAAIYCMKYKYPDATKTKITNTIRKRPKKFEIDCLAGNRALEIKCRDATTDGDHIMKEHTRVRVISEKGLIPVRVMFYYPQRQKAQRVQETLETLYKGIGGKYYSGDSAWNYIKEFTGVNLLEILEQIASSRRQNAI